MARAGRGAASSTQTKLSRAFERDCKIAAFSAQLGAGLSDDPSVYVYPLKTGGHMWAIWDGVGDAHMIIRGGFIRGKSIALHLVAARAVYALFKLERDRRDHG